MCAGVQECARVCKSLQTCAKLCKIVLEEAGKPICGSDTAANHRIPSHESQHKTKFKQLGFISNLVAKDIWIVLYRMAIDTGCFFLTGTPLKVLSTKKLI